MASAPVSLIGSTQNGDAAVGLAVRAALGDRCPWLAVQTSFSALHGTVTPQRWATALSALWNGAPETECLRPDQRGSNHPAPGAAVLRAARASAAALMQETSLLIPVANHNINQQKPAAQAWAALADVGDLAGLPGCCAAWGRQHVAVGAVLPLSAERRGAPPVLLLAPDAHAYRRLCRLLSWHHEDPTSWQAWLSGLSEICPAWDGVVALVQDAAWGERLRWHGAEVYWRVPGAPGPDDYTSVALPLLTDIDHSGQKAAQLLHLIQDRSQVRAHIEAVRGRVASATLAQLPQALARVTDEAIARGHELAARCRYVPGELDAHGQQHWHMPPWAGQDAVRELHERCRYGVHQRYGGDVSRAVRVRLDYELGVVTRKGFASYILIVADIAKGRRTCGRGSAASSLICYVLGITNVDPVRYHLMFERFLSDERMDPPDIDVDFPWDERDAVLAYVINTYGHDHVAMVATHQTMQRDGALREAGRVLGRDRADITAAAQRQDVARRYGNGAGAGDDWQDILQAADRIAGLMRGYGLHCGGIVITSEPIRDLVPVHSAAKTVSGHALPVIAWEKDGAEAMGLVKIDLLGNRSLAVVRDVLGDLRDEGIAVDEWRWAPDRDLLTLQLIAQGRTMGCFYVESPAMRQLIRRCDGTDFDQLVLLSSIVRPAAFHWIGTYLERLHYFKRTGEHQDAWYPHPALRGLLSQSFGVLSYQEDVMLSARDLAGFDIRLQNKLRKALGRTDTPQRLASLAQAFYDGCSQRGVERSVIDTVWGNIVSFAGYSFCKAHSASYAMVSFACACLKAHNPAHFLARVIHNDGGFYTLTAYVEEARRFGVSIKPPCVLQGFPDTKGENNGTAIRLGFELIKGLHRRTQDAIVRERQRLPFTGIRDFWRRCRPSASELMALLDAGALVAITPQRTNAERDWLVQVIAQEPRAHGDDDDQLRFDFAPITTDDPVPPSTLPLTSPRDLDRRAWNVLHCLPRAHPFALWDLPPRRLLCRDIGPHLAKRTVLLLVWVITRKQVEAVQAHDKNGTPLTEPKINSMAFITLEDDTGTIESTWFPEPYRRHGELSEKGQPFWITARVAVDHGETSLEVTEARGK